MKKYVYMFLSLILFFGSSISMANTLKEDAKLYKVTVYLTGAELNYTLKQSLPKGKSKVFLPNISPNMLENSARVSVDNAVKIISVSFETVKVNYETTIKNKQDSIISLNDKLARLQMEIASYQIEGKLLTENITRIGNNQVVSSAELLSATKLYREKLFELDNIQFKLQKEESFLSALKKKLEEEKSKLLQEQSKPDGNKSKQMIIEVEAGAELSATFDVNYLVSDAGWSPLYSIRAKNMLSEVELEYRAMVYNNTGVNWKNVAIALSSAATETKLNKPELGYAWTLDFNSQSNLQQANNGATGEGYLSKKQLNTNSKVEYVDIQAPEFDFYINLATSYDIPTDNEPHQVSVGDYKLPARYKYYAVPKVDDHVYLIAYLNGWQKLNIIEGQTSIYYNNTFIGNSTITTQYSPTELEISLGVDKEIQLSKVKKEDKESQKTIGTNRFVKLAYHIDVKNNKSKEVELEITDQVPISGDSDIEVEIIEISGATRDEQTGKLTWNLVLPPSESKKLITEFSVKYPRNKDKNISFTLFRFGRQKVICPKFR